MEKVMQWKGCHIISETWIKQVAYIKKEAHQGIHQKVIGSRFHSFILLLFVFNVGNEKIVQTQMVANILAVNENNFYKLDGQMW